MIHDVRGEVVSVATMDMALHTKTVERYDREGGWPVIVFDDGASLKFVSNEIEGIAIYRHGHERVEEGGGASGRFRRSK